MEPSACLATAGILRSVHPAKVVPGQLPATVKGVNLASSQKAMKALYSWATSRTTVRVVAPWLMHRYLRKPNDLDSLMGKASSDGRGFFVLTRVLSARLRAAYLHWKNNCT